MLTMARFGLWDSILGEPRPADELVFLVGIWHYTQGLAQVRVGAGDEARQSLAELRVTAHGDAAKELALASGMAESTKLLEIAIAHLEGEIAIAEDRHEEAIVNFQTATELNDSLAYTEPPPWYSPPRHALGALLLELGRASDAEAVYREDLRQYPKNGWSLLGLSQSLSAQGESEMAAWAQKGFEAAWARADVELTRSTF